VRAKGVIQVAEHALALQAACLHDGQDALSEAAARLAGVAQALPAPPHGAAQQPFHRVVGRLDAPSPGALRCYATG
jgi:hypothetical protein